MTSQICADVPNTCTGRVSAPQRGHGPFLSDDRLRGHMLKILSIDFSDKPSQRQSHYAKSVRHGHQPASRPGSRVSSARALTPSDTTKDVLSFHATLNGEDRRRPHVIGRVCDICLYLDATLLPKINPCSITYRFNVLMHQRVRSSMTRFSRHSEEAGHGFREHSGLWRRREARVLDWSTRSRRGAFESVTSPLSRRVV